MDTEIISIRVDAEAAKNFKSLAEQHAESLEAVMNEISQKTKEPGLTPEILKSLLDEELRTVSSWTRTSSSGPS